MANVDNLANVPVSGLKWSGRTTTALRNGGLLDKTLADLEVIRPEELLSVNRLGRGALAEITNHITQAKSRAREMRLREEIKKRAAQPDNVETATSVPVTINDPVVDFALTHQSLIQGIMNGEMVLVPKLD